MRMTIQVFLAWPPNFCIYNGTFAPFGARALLLFSDIIAAFRYFRALALKLFRQNQNPADNLDSFFSNLVIKLITGFQIPLGLSSSVPCICFYLSEGRKGPFLSFLLAVTMSFTLKKEEGVRWALALKVCHRIHYVQYHFQM